MKQIVCLADHPWSAIPTRTQQLLARLRDARILYFEPGHPKNTPRRSSARRVRPNILVYTLPRVPDPDELYGLHLHLGRKITAEYIKNRLRHHGFANFLLWVTDPRYTVLLEYLPCRGLIYDCDTYRPESLALREGALAQAADVIFAASPGLAEHLSPCNANIALIPNGVNFPMFCRADPDVPSKLAGITGPVLGWAGHLTPGLGLEPVEYAAAEHPGWTFVLANEGEDGTRFPVFRNLHNVLYLSPCGMADLPGCLGRFDVCLSLLQPDTEDTDVIPGRIYEYLSTGKPIVSMLYEEQVEIYPDVVYGAHTNQEFSSLCARALAEAPGWVTERRQNYGRAAAWTVRSDEVRRILESIGLY